MEKTMGSAALTKPSVQLPRVVLSVWLLLVCCSLTAFGMESHIVYLGRRHESIHPDVVVASHHNMLASVLGSTAAAKDALLYSYKHGFNGFAARLSSAHISAVSQIPGVISVFPNKRNNLLTTRSWEFLGLEKANENKVFESSLWKKSNFGRDIIIGSLDTGVWPESESYSDDLIGTIPRRWKGSCIPGTAFNATNCNRKLIGARYYIKGYEAENHHLNLTALGDFLSPRDSSGHGTHTSSTAAGSFVQGANLFGLGNGTAKGGAPLSRIAVYKVCWPRDSKGGECYDSDILAAIDQGIHDGVDVFTLSLGSSPPLPEFFEDGIAIGAFHAVQKGIVVVCAGGNDGPTPATVANTSPWIITVAASSIDRIFASSVVLGNNKTYVGQSLSEHRLKNKIYDLVLSEDVGAATANKTSSKLCFSDSLDPKKVKGKIIVCQRGITPRAAKGNVVKLAGGSGMVLYNAPSQGDEIFPDAHLLPATHVNAKDGSDIVAYVKSKSKPVAYISPVTTVKGSKPAPVMASFSSQGPNSLTPDLLKPDITAPGLDILAAYSEVSSPTGLPADNRVVHFNVESGTSMACPHVAGIAALLKAHHPDWSPAAIKSALMTTGTHLDNRRKEILNGSFQTAGPFNYGAGHIDPNKATDPGLVYDATTEDYDYFLCALKYNQSSYKSITGREVHCPKSASSISNMNYPSITVSNLVGTQTIKRTVTNVGAGNTTYNVSIKMPRGISVSVHPPQMHFLFKGESKSFVVKLQASRTASGRYTFGHITWRDGRHTVRSPIVVRPISTGSR
ncbi:hypothetical protein O6H91_13G011000 [Diphasiastrum complanatum]|uniref:Uncharacterized protein n=2 Tax=Diphasiastrum complanatum TaxID=34168 RepID=A0ACC2BSE6_DIPCM|nr:hypothetical protein O6H91_13G011000 [Diphasiastrum complanatum]KAJ7532584.1 hypothetical protein O6H91_13G011000 [Diphasiastrum complanatum]